jgi:hypothetical protein
MDLENREELEEMAKAVFEELKRLIVATQGEITVGGLLDHASNPDSVLHPLFDWDDKEAADKWREHRMYGLIGCIEEAMEKAIDYVVTMQ